MTETEAFERYCKFCGQFDDCRDRCQVFRTATEGNKLKIMLDAGAYEPLRAHPSDAGLDLRTPVSFWLHPGECVMIDTGVHVDIPDGYVGMITSKSKLMKDGITSRGTIDAHYLGSIKAVMYNSGKEGHLFNAGDKLTQLVIMPIVIPELEYVYDLGESDRGENGFGSSGA